MRYTLLLCLFVFSSKTLSGQSGHLPIHPSNDLRHQFSWQTSSRHLNERNNFPVLLLDSLYCDHYQNYSPYNLQGSVYESFVRNAQKQIVKQTNYEVAPPFFESLKHTFYTYDAAGREITELFQEEPIAGNLGHQLLTETSYSSDGSSSEAITFQWQNMSWVILSKTYTEYDAQQREVYSLVQIWNGTDWANNSQMIQQWHADGSLALTRSDAWDGTQWYSTFQNEYSLDNNNRLVNFLYSSGSATTQLAPAERTTFQYDQEGRQDSSSSFVYLSNLNQWYPTALETYNYNAQDELQEKWFYRFDNGEFKLIRKEAYTFGAMVYTDSATVVLAQTLDTGSGTFLYNDKRTNEYVDLPNDRVVQSYDRFNQYPPGSGTWTPNWICDLYYTKDALSTVDQPVQAQPCTAPNPYPIGYQVQCPGLMATRDYMLWVYAANGTAVYARHFNGAEGWSIARELPAGVYVAVVQLNGQSVQTQRLVVGN